MADDDLAIRLAAAKTALEQAHLRQHLAEQMMSRLTQALAEKQQLKLRAIQPLPMR